MQWNQEQTVDGLRTSNEMVPVGLQTVVQFKNKLIKLVEHFKSVELEILFVSMMEIVL